MANTNQCTMRRQLGGIEEAAFEVDTTVMSGTTGAWSSIKEGDLLVVDVTSGKISLLGDPTPVSNYAFIGVANGAWTVGDRNRVLPVYTRCYVSIPMVNATYAIGSAVTVPAGNTGTGTAHTAGKVFIGSFVNTETSSLTLTAGQFALVRIDAMQMVASKGALTSTSGATTSSINVNTATGSLIQNPAAS